MIESPLWLLTPSAMPTALMQAKAGAFRVNVRQTPRIPSSGRHLAVIPIEGVVTQHDHFMGTPSSWIAQQLEAALSAPSIDSILLKINSHGGTVAGTPELAETIYRARQQKTIVAAIHGWAGCAAYWFATACDLVYLTPSGLCGGIGCAYTHLDVSGMMDQQGVNPTVITSGKYKWEGHPFAPLGDEARAEWQRRADYWHDRMVQGIARNRRVSSATVRATYGQGRILPATDAKAAGMVDAILPFDKVVQSFANVLRRENNQRRADAMLWESRLKAVNAN